ncbi:MAG: hypothetical protein IJE24_02665 [Oscillospiraceae bacterium]|nr:hypothetical protein [Oscillospiraceae bacterium]
MAQAGKGKLNYRCPSCFIRDIDIDMFYEEEKKEYYCLRCGFSGQEEDVLRLNEQIRFRYRCMKLRVTDFSEDNQPVKFAPHKGGTQ